MTSPRQKLSSTVFVYGVDTLCSKPILYPLGGVPNVYTRQNYMEIFSFLESATSTEYIDSNVAPITGH